MSEVCVFLLEYFTLFYAIEAVVLNFVYEHVHMPLRL